MFNFSVSLDSSSNIPLYQQLYDYVVSEIRSGNLEHNNKMPSKRKLSENLSISVNTVDTAYQMLCSEGYIISQPKKGFFVAEIERFNIQKKLVFSYSVTQKQDKKQLLDMTTSGLDTTLFPYKTWGRIGRETLSQGDALLNHGDRKGDERLRVEIARYLHEYRAVNCSPDQIVVGAGFEYLVSLATNLFEDGVYGVENPGYQKISRIFKNCEKKTEFISVDQNGIIPDEIEKSECNILYLTPSHQFPTGSTIPMNRRLWLVSWAHAQKNRYIFEDDYDSEFRFDRKPISSLQSLDNGQKVIYLGTFSRCLAPSIRIAYMVLPFELLERFDKLYSSYSSTVSRFEQHTLSKFIESGHFARHLSRLRVTYRNRRDRLIDALYSSFGKHNISLLGEHTGLHMVVRFDDGTTETEIVQSAKNSGIIIRGLSEYYTTSNRVNFEIPNNSVVLGYGALSEQELERCIEKFLG